MSRSISIGAVVLLSAGVAYGDARGEVVSYSQYVGISQTAVILPVVPEGGFVLTDVFVDADVSCCFRLAFIQHISSDESKLGNRSAVCNAEQGREMLK